MKRDYENNVSQDFVTEFVMQKLLLPEYSLFLIMKMVLWYVIFSRIISKVRWRQNDAPQFFFYSFVLMKRFLVPKNPAKDFGLNCSPALSISGLVPVLPWSWLFL